MSEPASHSSVLDIDAEQLGKVYARALLGAAQQNGSTDQVLADLDRICDEALASNPRLLAAFRSPRIDLAEKVRVIDRLFTGADPILMRFMKVMAGRGRLGYLVAVRDAAVKLHDELAGRVVAEVRTAVAINDQLRGEIRDRLASKFGREVRLREIVDEQLIGGMVIRVGDTVFDSSVSSRLDKLGRAASAGFARQLIQQADRFTSST